MVRDKVCVHIYAYYLESKGSFELKRDKTDKTERHTEIVTEM